METATKLRLDGVNRLYDALGVNPSALGPSEFHNTGARVDYRRNGTIMKDGEPTGLKLCLKTGDVEDSDGLVGKVRLKESFVHVAVRCPETHLGTGFVVRYDGTIHAAQSKVEEPYVNQWKL